MNKTFRYTYKVVLQKGSLKGKCYYGQHTTTNLFDGYRGSGNIVRNYYKKYPERSSSIVYIQKFYDTKEELDQAEKELIEPHLGKDYCLNIAEGGHGGDTGPCTEEIRKKISIAVKASMTPERRACISSTMKGKLMGVKHPMYGKHPTEETRAKMSAVKKGHKVTDETREKVSAAMKGHKVTDETRVKISDAMKGDKSSSAKPTTIQNTLTNETLTFGCEKDAAEFLQVRIDGAFRRFKKGLSTRVPQLKNWKIIK